MGNKSCQYDTNKSQSGCNVACHNSLEDLFEIRKDAFIVLNDLTGYTRQGNTNSSVVLNILETTMDKVVILQGLNPNVMPSIVNIEEIVEDNQPEPASHSQKQDPSASPKEQADQAVSDKDSDHAEHDEHCGEFDFDMNFGAPDEKSLEELGTLLSAFFQDDKGTNVVDAIRENSRVHLKIARTLEKILKGIDKNS